MRDLLAIPILCLCLAALQVSKPLALRLYRAACWVAGRKPRIES